MKAEETRFHSLDVLRAGALLLGILLHASMSFMPGFRALGWPIADASTSTTLDVLFYVLHIFRMTLFFLLAGFFARLLLQKLGTWDFIRHRLKRIALPLVIFYPLVMPLTILPMVWAAKQLGMTGGPGPGRNPLAQGVPWGHFWFLYLLLLLYVLLLLARGMGGVVDRGGVIRRMGDGVLRFALESRLAPLMLAVPLAAVLYLTPWWPMWAGIPAPIAGFVPNTPALLAFGMALLVGWWLHRDRSLLELLRRDWKLYLLAALAASVAALWLVGTKSNFGILQLPPATRLGYAVAYMTAVWCWCLGLTGLAMAWSSAPNPRWRYLADASYWMYIIHVPIVWGLQAWMMRWSLHWSLKYGLILGISAVLLLGSYHYLVRGTFIGKLLNGRKYPRIRAATPAPNTSPG
jgi:peptidoglycan/LPS O-acetylase OafA/YrhL